MTETKNPGEKTLTVTPTKTLTLKRSVEQGVVRQSFSHGRTKAVVVEKVKRRTMGPGDGKVAETAPAATPPVSTPRRGAGGRGAAAGGATQHAPGTSGGKPAGVVLRQLTEEERTARAHALAESKVSEAEERRMAEEAARRRDEKDRRTRRARGGRGAKARRGRASPPRRGGEAQGRDRGQETLRR